eukprot:611765_1
MHVILHDTIHEHQSDVKRRLDLVHGFTTGLRRDELQAQCVHETADNLAIDRVVLMRFTGFWYDISDCWYFNIERTSSSFVSRTIVITSSDFRTVGSKQISRIRSLHSSGSQCISNTVNGAS